MFCKTPVLFAVAILLSFQLTAQNITITRTGQNTWGGAYVPPVWTKTYDFTLKKYNITTSPTRSSSTSSSGSGSSGSVSYVKKSKWSFTSNSIDYEAIERAKAYRTEKAKLTAIEYGQKLNDAIWYYHQGGHRFAHNMLNGSLRLIVRKDAKEYENWDEVYEQLRKYEDVVNYYRFLAAAKCGLVEDAVMKYNLAMTTDDSYEYFPNQKLPPIDKLYPLTEGSYYFLDKNGTNRRGFKKYTIRERFLADLILVECLVDQQRRDEAKKVFQQVLDFYLPKIDTVETFLPQIAINHFYLGNVEEANDLFEYYWNSTESYDDRMNILNELVAIDKGLFIKNKWNRASDPEQYAFVRKNYFFLDSIISIKKPGVFFSDWFAYRLFVERGNETDPFIELMEVKLNKPFDSLYYNASGGSYNMGNETVEMYLAALLKKGDKEKIRQTLAKLTTLASKIRDQKKLRVEDELKGNEEYRQYPDIYWGAYYRTQARPAVEGLYLFRLMQFHKEGGGKYLREAAKPFLDELSDYTEKEWPTSFLTVELEQCGLRPDFRKRRNNPTELPVTKWLLEKQAADKKEAEDKLARATEKENAERKAELDNINRDADPYRKMEVPLGAIALIEKTIKAKQLKKQALFDSASLAYAKDVFNILGYEKGKSLHADIMMSAIEKDPSKIMDYLSEWTIEKLLLQWYNGSIKTAEHATNAGEEIWEEAYMHSLLAAAQYEKLNAYFRSVSWATGIKYGHLFVESLCMAGKPKEAINFIGHYHNRTRTLHVDSEERDMEYVMDGIVLFHQKEYKKAWEKFDNGSSIPNTIFYRHYPDVPGLQPDLYFPWILITRYAYYYFSCAKELKKDDYKPLLQKLTMPRTTPAFMKEKYGSLFNKME